MTKSLSELLNIAHDSQNVIKFENLIYAYARSKSDDTYNGGYWESKNLNNDSWFFCLNSTNDKLHFTDENSNCIQTVSAKCFSVLCFTFALNHIISILYEEKEEDILWKEFNRLYNNCLVNIDLLLNDEERKIFFSIID